MSDMSSVSEDEQRILVAMFKAGGLLSMGGSFLIMRDVWFRFREKKEIPLTAALVFELSVCDFCSSLFGPFLGTWMVPKETGVFMAAGNAASCTAQGFFVTTFYAASALCNTSLAVAYCLIVKKGWKDYHANTIGSWLLRALPLLSLSLSVGPFFDEAFNFSGVLMCEIESYPYGCGLDGSNIECTRGQRAVPFKLFALSALLLLNFIIIASISMLIQSVCAVERKMSNYSLRTIASNENSLKTKWQGIWYIAAFGLAWWPFAIKYLVKMFTAYPPAFLNYIHALTWPAQGAYNAFVYFRPKYKSDRERNTSDGPSTSVRRVLHISELGLLSVSVSKQRVGNEITPSKASDSDIISKSYHKTILNAKVESRDKDDFIVDI